jgi:molybdate transport system substrate-binding protein
MAQYDLNRLNKPTLNRLNRMDYWSCWLLRVATVSLVLSAASSGLACGGPRSGGSAPPLSIAAASDLRYVLDDLVVLFREAHPGTEVATSYGSSGNFFAQLLNNAPFDLFLSADVAYPRQLIERGIARPESLFTYADGRLVVWVPASSSLDVVALGLKALTDPSVTRIAIANPEHAPYGRAAEAALRSTGLLSEVKPKLILGDNVSQTLQFVQSGAAQAGIVALSLAVAPAVAPSGRYWLVPSDAHPRLEQGGVIMRVAARADAAQAFRTFMQGDQARKALARDGFARSE